LKSTTPYPLGKGKKVSDEQGTLPMVQTYPDVVISTYAKLAGWASTLVKKDGIRSVVFDECQELRSGETRQGNPIAKNRAAKHIAAKVDYRLGCSGTPIYNYGSEMFNVMECLRPGALGELAEFNREWCSGYSEAVEDPKAFGAFLRQEGLMLRRTREDVGRELPPLSRIFHDIDSDPEEIDNIEEAATGLAKLILQEGPEAVRGERMKSSGELSYLLRQATGLAKAGYVAEFVRMIVDGGEPVVLFGWHHGVYKVWKERLATFNPVMVTGQESGKQKDDALQAFARGESKVIIISLRALAGLDGLQFASSTVVHGELDWSPGVHEQCDTRIFRDGQEKPVIAYYLTSTDGSDPVLSEALREKGEQLEGIRDPDAEFFEKLQTNDAERVRNLAEAFLNRRARSKEVA
jgi:SNF2 family DNA or RNA helicase